MERITIGEKLRQLREASGISQDELSRNMNVTRQTISNWENDKRMPDIYVIRTIAEYYQIKIDELCGNVGREENIKIDKMAGRFIIAAILLSFIYMIVGILTEHFYIGIFIVMITTGIFCAGFLHLVIKSAIEDDNMGMLAGYDSKVEYHMPAIKRMLKHCDTHIAYMTFAINMLLFISAYTDKIVIIWSKENLRGFTSLSMLLTLYYCVDLTATIMLYNYKGRESIYKHEKDLKVAEAGWISVMWYVIMVFAICGAGFFGGMRNNSLEAAGYAGWLLLFIVITTAELFYEQRRAKKLANEAGGYHVGWMFWGTTAMAAAILFHLLRNFTY